MRITNGAYIIDKRGNILITHPTNHVNTLWSIPKGLTDDDETSKEAAIREVWEETNLDLELFINKTIYRDMGSRNYGRKKRLNAHFFYIDLPLSEMDLNLWCKSRFDCEETGANLPENDITKWETLKFAREFLHYSQKEILNKVEILLGSVDFK